MARSIFFQTVLLLFVLLCGTDAQEEKKKPNFLFVFTDDQDLELGSLEFMKQTTSRIQDEGFTFGQHYATCALCCPSRVSLLRGQQAHNTNNTDTQEPGGGYPKFMRSGEDANYLPLWMQRAGYQTEYIGKFMNLYSTKNYAKVPRWYDHFDGLLDPFTYDYFNSAFSENGARPKHYKAHQTDVIHKKAIDRLDVLLDGDKPWFLTIAPAAIHQKMNESGIFPPDPPVRDADLFPGLKAPRSKNFNPEKQDKPSWLGELPLMGPKKIAFSDETYRRRAQTLQGIDRMVDHLLDVLEKAGQLDNTYVIFSSDQGYHLGNHRVTAGKRLPYREDTHIPFFVRGPKIPKGKTELPSSHIDFAPTLLTLAGLRNDSWPHFLDGRDLSAYWKSKGEGDEEPELDPWPETINVEFWGGSGIETELPGTDGDPRSTVKTVRIVGKDYGYLYSHWCTHETELYDTLNDPEELKQLDLKKNKRLANRLNGLLLALKTCERGECRDPWRKIHPRGKVRTLAEALEDEHDELYEGFEQVAFGECLRQQIPGNEVPFFPGFDPAKGFGKQYRRANEDAPAAGGAKEARDIGEKDKDVPFINELPVVRSDEFQTLEDVEKSASFLSDDLLKRSPPLPYQVD